MNTTDWTMASVNSTTEKNLAFYEELGLSLPLFIVVVCCIIVALVTTMFCIFCCFCKRTDKQTSHLDRTKSLNKKNNCLNGTEPMEENAAGASSKQQPTGELELIIMDKIENAMKKQVNSIYLESKRLTVGPSIGTGRFGIVYKATLTDNDLKNPQEVAAKTVAGENCLEKEVSDFLEEVMRMRSFQHRHVLATVGLVLRDNRPYAVLPFMKNGDLKTYLKDVSKPVMIVRYLVTYCCQIADGMCYLSEQGFIHGDLATRNCMVDENEIIKIGDFGLSRDIFCDDYYRMENLDQSLPVRWMAAESIQDIIFTVKTDVWSYGVVMWEIMTRGKMPFNEKENHEVVKHIQEGGKLKKPQFCPDEIFSVMKMCWRDLPKDRPDFRELTEKLQGILRLAVSKNQKKTVKYYNHIEVDAYVTRKQSPKKEVMIS